MSGGLSFVGTKPKPNEAIHFKRQDVRTVLDQMLEGCQIISFDYRYLYANHAVVRQSKHTRSELLGKKMVDVYPGIEKTHMFTLLKRCMRQRKHFSLENEFTFPDGEKRWFDLRIEPVREGALILSFDITLRRAEQAELRRLIAESQAILESIGEGLVAVDVTHKVFLVNKAAESILGLKAKQLLTAMLLFCHLLMKLVL